MSTEQPTAPARQGQQLGSPQREPAVRRAGIPILLLLALALVCPVAASSPDSALAESSTLDTIHMTTAQKVQAYLEGQAVVSLVGLILCFAGGACLVVMARREYRSASRRTIREMPLLSAARKVIPINSYRATTAALRSGRLAEAAVASGLAEPGKAGSGDPAQTDQLLDRLLQSAARSGSSRRWPFVVFGDGRGVRYSSRFVRLSWLAPEQEECHESGETHLGCINQ